MAGVDRGDWEPVKDALLRNNVISHSLKVQGGLWQRTKETFGRMIPVWSGIKHAGKSVGGFKAEGMDSGGSDTGTVSPDQFIEKACDSAINPSK